MTKTPSSPQSFDPDEDDLLAAEYVLGVLPREELARLAHRVEADLRFARLVGAWEDRLHPLAEEFAPEPVRGSVKRALDLRLFGEGARQGAGLWANLLLWRGLAGLSTLALLLALALPMLRPITPAEQLAASLRAEGSAFTYLAVYDPQSGQLRLAHLTGEPVDGRDFELWVAEGTAPPVSLGLIPPQGAIHVALDEGHRGLMTSAAHIAISLEPPGGSPTGQPTGPVLAVGDLLKL